MKDEKQIITSSFEINKSVRLEDGEVEVLVSNSGLDRHGEQILVEGIDLKAIKQNPVVLWGHDYASLPIGKINKIWKSAGNLMARIKLATEVYDFANMVYKLIQEGVINAVSIGGIVKEWNEDFSIIKKMEMIELSVVPVGAHPDALVTAKALNISEEQVKKSFEEFMMKSVTSKEQKTVESEPKKITYRITI